MPKATNKQKQKKADFSKAKLKLGKGKQQASNATDTSFKARSIALPDQSALDRALAPQNHGEPITSAGLVLDEVLVRLRHPNAGVRREALVGVKEILMGDAPRETGKVLRAFGGLVSDEDATVRKTLHDLLAWYLQNIAESLLVPHLPLFLMQVSSALSHIFPDIRLDAAKLVYLLLEHVPSHVVAPWPAGSSSAPNASSAGPSSTAQGAATGAGAGSTILEGLRLALGLGGEKASAAQGRLSAGGKLVLMRTMLRFLRYGLDGRVDAGGVVPAADVQGIFAGWKEDGGKARGCGRVVKVGKDAMLAQEGWVVPCLSGLCGVDGGWEMSRLDGLDAGEEDQTEGLSALYLQLHPLLLSTFLESAPTAFSPSATSFTPQTASSETHVELCTVSCALAETLARPILTSASTSHEHLDASPSTTPSISLAQTRVRTAVTDLIRRLSAYFPFSTPPSRASAALAASGVSPAFALNLSYANLAVLLAPQPPRLEFAQRDERGRWLDQGSWEGRVRAVERAWEIMRASGGDADLSTGRTKGNGKGKGKGVDAYALGEVADWVEEVLGPKQDVLAPALSPAAFTSLLPIVWSLLTQAPPSNSSDSIPDRIGLALLSHISRSAPTSPARTAGDAFLAALIETHEQRHPVFPFHIPRASPLRAALGEWVTGLPRALWELGARDARASKGLLRCLLALGQRGADGSGQGVLQVETYVAIPPRLAAFFWMGSLPGTATEGGKKKSGPGPWGKVDEDIKGLALDVATVWAEWDPEGRLDGAVRAAKAAVKY